MTAWRNITARLRQLLLYRAEYNFLKRQQQTIADALATTPANGINRLHLALLRNLRVTWLPLESGAPGLRQFLPFGKDNSTLKAGAQLIGHRDETLLARALVETAQLIPDFCMTAVLAPGRYAIPSDLGHAASTLQTGPATDAMFDFTEQHAILLRHLNWRMDMLDPLCWPLPSVDGKRPYGDCTHFQIDMASHLGLPYPTDLQGEAVTDAEHDAMLENLHWQMLIALQVFLMHAQLPASDLDVPSQPQTVD